MDENTRRAYDGLIAKSLETILKRFEKNSGNYGFIDTKFNIVSGEDFSGGAEYFRRDWIFGWIQGRALESLAKHYSYYEKNDIYGFCPRIKAVLEKLCAKLEMCRRNNGGHITFVMDTDGTPIGKVSADNASFADLFYGKGLFCASKILNDSTLEKEGCAILDAVFDDIQKERFISGQQSFDPKNPASNTSPDKLPEGPRMIALGALADLIDLSDERRRYADIAADFIGFILDNHFFMLDGRACFCEDIHRTTREHYRENGQILCDPGHGLEFTGLAGRTLRKMEKHGFGAQLKERCRGYLPQLFISLFDCGFQKNGGGIVKALDALSTDIINSDMPWWSLPESIRSAAELARLYPEFSAELLSRQSAASRAMLDCYLQPNGFCCQTRDKSGNIVNVIPAVPDADPGYHTNLSLMEV